MMSVRPVPVEFVHQVWPTVRMSIIASVKESSGESLYSLGAIRQKIAEGTWELFVVVDDENKIHGAGTVEYIHYPMHRVAFITALGGTKIVSRDTFSQFLSFVKMARGATLVQAYGRPAIVRLYRRVGLSTANTLVEIRT